MNQFYLTHIATDDVRAMVEAHAPLHGGRLDHLCYLTTAAMAWLLTGADCVPPFSGAWLNKGTGPPDADRAIAFGFEDDGEYFDEDHTLIVLVRDGASIVLDSHLREGRALTVRAVGAVPMPPPGQVARYVLLSHAVEPP